MYVYIDEEEGRKMRDRERWDGEREKKRERQYSNDSSGNT